MILIRLAMGIEQGPGHDAIAIGHGDGREDKGEMDDDLPLYLDLAGGDDMLGEVAVDAVGEDRVLDVDEGL